MHQVLNSRMGRVKNTVPANEAGDSSKEKILPVLTKRFQSSDKKFIT